MTGDGNNNMDGFVRDYRSNASGVTSLVTYNVDGAIPNAYGSRPQLDDSGDIVGFVSTSARIVKGDTNGREDAFIRNWKQEKADGPGTHTFLLAVSPTGDPGVCPGLAELDEGTSAISTRVYLSGDGTSAVFVSADCNLTLDAAHGGPDTNLAADIFLRHYGTTAPPPPPKLNGLGRFFPAANPTRVLDTRQPGHSRIVGRRQGHLPDRRAPPGTHGRVAGRHERHRGLALRGRLPHRVPDRHGPAERLQPELRAGPDGAEPGRGAPRRGRAGGRDAQRGHRRPAARRGGVVRLGRHATTWQPHRDPGT